MQTSEDKTSASPAKAAPKAAPKPVVLAAKPAPKARNLMATKAASQDEFDKHA